METSVCVQWGIHVTDSKNTSTTTYLDYPPINWLVRHSSVQTLTSNKVRLNVAKQNKQLCFPLLFLEMQTCCLLCLFKKSTLLLLFYYQEGTTPFALLTLKKKKKKSIITKKENKKKHQMGLFDMGTAKKIVVISTFKAMFGSLKHCQISFQTKVFVFVQTLALESYIARLSRLIQQKRMADCFGVSKVPQSSSIIDFAKSTFNVQILLRLLSLWWLRAHWRLAFSSQSSRH